MFTGIIETVGKVVSLQNEGTNLHIDIQSSLSDELKIDQSISHNGVCLTVVALAPGQHTVTAIDETLKKSTIGSLQVGNEINLERCTIAGGRLDGHIVQGHVDQTGTCISIRNENGSWVFTFQYDPSDGNITVEKGSISINGISLTVFDSYDDRFSVAIIPYTYENTNMKHLKIGDLVNLEFDIIGKYVAKTLKSRLPDNY